MNLVESEPILKIEKEKQGDERQQFNIKRNELVESGKYVGFPDAKYDYVIKKNQVVKNGAVYDNLDYDLDIEKGKKKEEIESNFTDMSVSTSQIVNEIYEEIAPIFGYKIDSEGLITFNTGITKLQVDALLHELASKFSENYEYQGVEYNNKETAFNVLTIFFELIEKNRPKIRKANAFINLGILNKKKKSELLAQLEVATTLEEVQAIDVEKAKQEVQIELAGLTGLNGVEGVEGL